MKNSSHQTGPNTYDLTYIVYVIFSLLNRDFKSKQTEKKWFGLRFK